MIVSVFATLWKNKETSDLQLTKPVDNKLEPKFWHNNLGAYLSLYKDFLSLHTKGTSDLTSKLKSWVI